MRELADWCMAAVAAVVLVACELRARRGSRVLERRLQRHAARRTVRSHRVRGAFRRLDRRLVRARMGALVEQRLREAGISVAVSNVLLVAAAGLVLGAAAVAAAGGLIACAAALVLFPGAAWLGLGAACDRRCRRLDLQLPAALDLLIGQLRAHRSPAEAIAEIPRRLADPLRTEFARLAEELALGVPLSQGLDALRRRVPSRSLGAIVTAMLVAERSGGNLAGCLSRQSEALREHLAFLQEVRAVTAHARGTATILTLFPIGVAAAMLTLDPRAMGPLFASRAGHALLTAAVALQIIGWCTMRAMIRSVTR